MSAVLNAMWATALVMCLLTAGCIAVGLILYTAALAEGQPRAWALGALFCLLIVVNSFLLAFTFNVGREAWLMVLTM